GGALLRRARHDVLGPFAAAVMALERVLELPPGPSPVVIDVDIEALAEPEPGGVPVLLGQLLLHERDLLGVGGRRLRSGAHEAVAVSRGPAHAGWGAAAEPHRRVWLLHGLGLHPGPLELPELAVEVDPLVRPARLHQRERLVEARDGPVGVDTEGGERAPLPAGGEP